MEIPDSVAYDLPIARPSLGPEEAEAAARVVRSGWVMQGPEVAAFEAEFAAYVGAAHGCAVSSGTAALQLALMAVGVGPGDEVVTVSHSFIATANSVRLCGATPIFVDIDDTLNLSAGLVEAAITIRTRAILCVHQLGMPCDLAALSEIAARRGVALIEDAACAVGSEVDIGRGWERIGRPHSHAACFSFHPRKILTTGEGGMVTTADPAVDARVRRLRQHGDSVEVGFNFRMTDIQAAIGRVQLGRLQSMLEKRRELAAHYRLLLDGAVSFQREPAFACSNWQSFYVRLPGDVDVAQVASRLAASGVATRPGIDNAHRLPIYAAAQQLPVSEAISKRGLMLPLFVAMEMEDVERVAKALRSALS